MSEDEREMRAFEAIIASQLLRERDPMNLEDLPELTESQRAAMSELPASLVEQLWEEVEGDGDEDCDEDQICTVEEEEFAGMNRSEEMTEETRNALDEARKEVIESLKRRREQDGANS